MNSEKRSFIFRIFIFVGFILALLVWLIWRYNSVGGTAEIYFMPLQDADAAVIQSSGKVMMIDTGAPEDEQTVLAALEAMKVERIDVLLLTHPDKDHIGNAAAILRTYAVGQIIMPDVKKGSELERQLLEEIAGRSVSLEQMQSSTKQLELGDCLMRLVPGEHKDYNQINDYSIVGILTCGQVQVFFGGDIENDRIKELLTQKLPVCDIVKIPHHGRDERRSGELIKALRPKLCIVTAEYAEPTVQAAITDQNSTVVFTAQGGVHIRISDNEWGMDR